MFEEKPEKWERVKYTKNAGVKASYREIGVKQQRRLWEGVSRKRSALRLLAACVLVKLRPAIWSGPDI